MQEAGNVNFHHKNRCLLRNKFRISSESLHIVKVFEGLKFRFKSRMFLIIKVDVPIFVGVGDVSFHYKSFPLIGVFLEII